MSTTPIINDPTPVATPDYTINKTDTGVEVKLASGHVYKGANEGEALGELAKAQYHADKTLLERKGEIEARDRELETYRQREQGWLASQTQTPEVIPTPSMTGEQFLQEAIQDPEGAVMKVVAKALGVEPQQLVEKFASHDNVISTVNADMTKNQFTSMCPDFPETQEAADALFKTVYETFGTNIVPTAKQLAIAHNWCVNQGIYKGVPQEQKTNNALRPAPVVSGTSNPDGNVTPIAQKSLEELRKETWDFFKKDPQGFRNALTQTNRNGGM